MDYWSLFVAFMGNDMEKFNANCRAKISTLTRVETIEDANNYIGYAFIWEKTPEGFQFWQSKQAEWRRFLLNPTKLHKLLAGIDHEN